ncbi:hypothetical protein [Meiothermus sp.]|nr:hypothetical protein [Meiothermus sp.]
MPSYPRKASSIRGWAIRYNPLEAARVSGTLPVKSCVSPSLYPEA